MSQSRPELQLTNDKVRHGYEESFGDLNIPNKPGSMSAASLTYLTAKQKDRRWVPHTILQYKQVGLRNDLYYFFCKGILVRWCRLLPGSPSKTVLLKALSNRFPVVNGSLGR